MTTIAVHTPRIRSEATAAETLVLRAAGAVARGIDRRVERRAERRTALLARLQAEQTQGPDVRALDHALAQRGLRLK